MPVQPKAPPWAHEGADIEVEQYELFDATFVDDEAIYVLCDTADGLLASVRVVLDALNAVFPLFGMVLNLQPGKTEVLAVLRGVRAKRA
eukprot:980166-Alexandrium_andersonii.AAC.1